MIRTCSLMALCALSAGGVKASAEGWTCRNEHFEIACYEGTCQNNSDFTPMSISVTATTMSVCAYTTCDEGPVTGFLQQGEFATWFSNKLRSSYYEDSADGQAVLSIDLEAGVGTLLNSAYATPVMCKVTGSED